MRNSSTTPEADGEPAGGVIAVSRALSLMEAFAIGESALSLAELSRRAHMHKTTALRLARTLALSNYMVQTDDGLWRLGPAAGWLGARYQAGFDVNNVVEPALHELVKATGESASFYVREGDIRSCVARVEGPQSVRHNVRIGERLPLDRGAPGRVILAFSGAAGEPYEGIRERGFHISMGERESEVSSVAAPVFALNWRLLGSMCISGPTSRLTKVKLEKHAKSVIRAANELSYALAGGRSAATPKAVSKWHP
ncbi:IclR family transcriptional regulator [Caenimonas sedimenti]|uniref:IclR family transcriptional regulator n=1 Tax=Caenimonas sedimenti TaxID=2596921 RepID=A0A562ZW59_9BURK|nr:IclR family transcriptional regulator [Caenimonas sedimenti]TWO72601.1 IclR family transcriptional regulator [Caenimonas sedimenti]